MRFYEISEARRNPNNPAQQRVPITHILLKYADDPSYYLSFTSLPKIGINPQT